jgi:integrase
VVAAPRPANRSQTEDANVPRTRRRKQYLSTNVTHAFHDALQRAELPRQRFHDLRHLAASLMLAQDVNPKVMQEILGHSQIAMTLDLYSHLMPTAKRDVAARMDALLTGTE